MVRASEQASSIPHARRINNADPGPAVRSKSDAAALRTGNQSIFLSVQQGKRAANLSEFFFPQKLPLDAAGVALSRGSCAAQFCQRANSVMLQGCCSVTNFITAGVSL